MTAKGSSDAALADRLCLREAVIRQGAGLLRQRLLVAACVAALYGVAARLGEMTAVPPTTISALWPPSGVVLAVVLLWGRSIWPGIFWGELIGSTWAFFDGSTAAGLAGSIGSGVAIAIGATLQPLLGAAATRRVIGRRNPLDHAADVFRFAAVAPAMCVVGATIGVTALGLRGVVPWSAYGLTWLTWWLGDTVGVLLVTPVVLAWRQDAPIQLSRSAVVEGVTFLVLLATLMGAVFLGMAPAAYAEYPLEILLLPPLAWLALRSNTQMAGTVAFGVAVTAVGATASGLGPFARGATLQSVLLAQVFVLLVAVTVHVMVAVVGERRRAESALIEAHAGLEQRVGERTAALTHTNQALQGEVAERQRVEAALLASEERFRALAHNATDLVVIVDPNARVRYVSPSIERILGYKPEQIVGTKAFDYLHPDDTAAFHDLFDQAVDLPGINPAAEFRARRADGSWVWFESVANNLLADPVVMGIVANARDVTERKRVEEALREREERFRSLIENGSDVITVLDKDGVIIYESPSTERVLGYDRSGFTGDFAFEYVHPDDVERLWGEFEALRLQPGATRAIEFRVRHESGGWRVLEALAHNQLDNPALSGIVVTSRDVTERRRAEDDLQRSHAQLRALSARLQSVREEASARIAREIHDELGQALTALKMDLAWVQHRIERSAAVRDKVKTMTQLVDATVQSVRRISTELRPGVLDDLGLTAAIEWQAREFQGRTGIECSFACGEDVVVDRDRATALFRILQESLTNVTRHAQATRVEVVLLMDTTHILLTVRDNGKGITEQQVSARNSLGLLGMRERVHAFGGEVSVHGANDRGTEISVRVPLAPTPPKLSSLVPHLGEEPAHEPPPPTRAERLT